MNQTNRAYGMLHLCVILWGFTAILGDLIALSAIVLVWWRVALTSVGMFGFAKVRCELSSLSKEQYVRLFFIGAIIGFHWVCFYGSIKLANASVGLIGVSVTALSTALLEPFVLKQALNRNDLIFGVSVIPGIILIADGLNHGMLIGLFVGFVAAILSALFAILNKKYLSTARPETITFVEMLGAWLVMSTVLLLAWSLGHFDIFWPSPAEWPLMLLLVVVCTIVPFVLHLVALKHISAFSSNLIMNLEPVYGIILAVVLLQEHKELSTKFYLGGAIVMAAIFLYPIWQGKEKSKIATNP